MIVDASVAFKWLVREPDSDRAIDWINADEPLAAPNLIMAETGHALTKRIRRKELEAEGAEERFARLPQLLTLLDDAPFTRRAFALSLELAHSFYDCLYLAAAQALDDRLLTADAVFAKKLAGHGLGDKVLMLGDKH